MKNMFVVLAMNSEKVAKESNGFKFWKKVKKKVSNGTVTLLYSCCDTSADSIIRRHAQKSPEFMTYLIVPLEINETASAYLLDIGLAIENCCEKHIVEATDHYQVISNQ